MEEVILLWLRRGRLGISYWIWTLWSTRLVKVPQVVVLEKCIPFYLFRCSFSTGIALVCSCPACHAVETSLQDQLSEVEPAPCVADWWGEWGQMEMHQDPVAPV